jgi:hypothetical protein
LGALQVDLQVTIAGPTYREEILFGNRVCSWLLIGHVEVSHQTPVESGGSGRSVSWLVE